MARTQRNVASAEELAQGANRLLYEVLMMSNAATLLDEEQPWDSDWEGLTRYMAVVESFLAHTHSLLSFLYPPKRLRRARGPKRRVLAADYCGEGWRARPWKGVGAVRKTIARDLAGLSFAELPAARSWEYARLVAALRGSLSWFLDDAQHLPPEVHEQIRTVIAGARQGGTPANPSIPAMPLPTRAGLSTSGIASADLLDSQL
jgi:hypothetical protein